MPDCAVTSVKRIARASHSSGAALHRDSLVLACFVLAELRQVVEVVIHERGACRPSRVTHAGGLSNVREGSVAVIFEEVVLSQTCHVEVVEPVVIIIPDRRPHPPADVADAGLVRDVGK